MRDSQPTSQPAESSESPSGPTPSGPPPALMELKGKRLFVVISGVLLGMALAALDQTIVATALPQIVSDLGGLDRIAWVVTAYMLTSTAGIPVWGKLSDMFGRRWFFITGLIIFMVGSMITGTAQTMNQLIIFRGIQGLGGGMMFGIAFAIIADYIPPSERGKWQGLFGGVFAVAGIVGPLLGGYLTDSLSWRWVFYVNLPVGILALALLVPSMPAVKPMKGRPSIDYLGVAALVGTIVPLLLGFSLAGQDYAWSSKEVVGLLTGAFGMLVAFIFIESRAKEPIMPFSIFKISIFRVSVITTFFTGVGMFGTIIFIPLYVQGVLGTSATSSGLLLMPLMLGTVAGSTIAGQLISRTGRYRVLGVIGTAVMTLGLFLMSTMDADVSRGTVARNMAVMGAGMGVTFPVFTIAVQNAASFSVLGLVTSLVQFFRSFGGTIGVAVLGSVLSLRLSSALEANIPSEVTDRIPIAELGDGGSPAALVNEEALAALRGKFEALGPEGAGLFDRYLDALKVSLSDAITDIFLIAAIMVSLSVVAALFLQEIRLRTSHAE
ncbi:MAG: MFS transporter, partial [Chloroflexi bacterium]|nr:MFS transporter [Chloroflexota bacterium]